MIVKQIVDEDFINYKKPSMFIAFPKCTWKCEKECGMRVCQNNTLATSPNIEINAEKIVTRYLNNQLTRAVVFGGLEPIDSYTDLFELVHIIRNKYKCNDDIVIYTGYNHEEITKELNRIKPCGNIVVKFGRFIPGHNPHYDEVLGVMLASDNQYAVRIS